MRRLERRDANSRVDMFVVYDEPITVLAFT